jgi:hypothetical protein
MGKCNFFKAVLKFVDAYEDSPRLNINGQTNLKTVIGGLLTLLSNLFFLGILIYNIVVFSTSNDPNATVTRQYRNTSQFEDLPYNLFNITTFLISVANGISPLNLTLKSAGFVEVLIDVRSEEGVKVTPIGTFKKCSQVGEDYVRNGDINRLFHIMSAEEAYCSEFNKQANLSLGGNTLAIGQEKDIGAQLTFDTCGYFGKNCTDRTFLNTVSNFYRLSMGIFTQNAYTDLNAKQGYSTYFDTPVYSIDLSKDYDLDIIVTKNTMETDINPIYDFFPPEVNIYYVFDVKFTERSRPVYDNNFNIYVTISLDNYEYKISRSYLKLDAMLANVMSITQIVSMLCMYINSAFATGNIEYEIFSKIYDFPNIGEEEISAIKRLSNKQLKKINLPVDKIEAKVDTSNHQDSKLGDKVSLTEVYQDRVDKIAWKLSKRKIKRNHLLLCYEFFPCLFRNKGPNSVIIEKASRVLTEEMDIVNMLKKLIVVEKMQQVVLTDYQRKGLQMMKIRNIYEKADEEAIIREIKDNNILRLDAESANYYAMLYEHLSNSEDETDKRLYSKLKPTYE